MADQLAVFADDNLTTDAMYSLLLATTADVTSAAADTGTLPLSTARTTTLKPCTVYDYPPCDPLLIAAYHFFNHGDVPAYCLGIPGSVLTVVILLRLRPFNSASVWLLAMCFIDLLSLSTRFINTYTLLYNVTESYDWSCRLVTILVNATENSSFCLLVGLTLERFIAVWFPLKMSIWCTKKRAALAAALVETVALACSMHSLETYRVNADKYCIMRLKYQPFWNGVYENIIQVTFLKTLPVAAIIALNILIYARLGLARQFQKQMTDQQALKKEKQQKQINRMLSAASFWCILCQSLDVVYRYGYTYIFPQRIPRDSVLVRAEVIVTNLSGMLRLYNHAANFVLYVIAARKFRSEVIKLITCNRHVAVGKRSTQADSKQPSTETKVTSDGSSYPD